MHSHSKEDVCHQHPKGPSFCGPNAQTSPASDPLVLVIERKPQTETIISKKKKAGKSPSTSQWYYLAAATQYFKTHLDGETLSINHI